MKNFQKAIIGLIFFLTVFFNIERLDLGSENTINISTFVYIISIIAIFTVIVSKRIAHFPYYYGLIYWFLIFILIKVFSSDSSNIFENEISLYLLITEVAFLSMSIILGRYTALLLFDMESTVENITLLGMESRVKAFKDASEEINLEIYRSRRFNAPLSIITIPIINGIDQITVNQIIEELQQEILKHYSVIRLAKVFQKNTRRTDKVLVNLEEDRIVVLAPQTNKDDASRLVANLQEATDQKLNIKFTYSIKSFPEDGHTFEKLYRSSLDDLEIINKWKNDHVV